MILSAQIKKQTRKKQPSMDGGNGQTLADSLPSPPPFASLPCSPGRSSANPGYFFSAPASPMHFLLSSPPADSSSNGAATTAMEQTDFEFGLAARSMSSAEELFVNGQIRPGFVFPDQKYYPDAEPVWMHRRTRSISPSRAPGLVCRDESRGVSLKPKSGKEADSKSEGSRDDFICLSTSRSSSSNSSSCNSSGSKRWEFIKDLLLQRSKSEGSSIAASGQKQRSSYNIRGSGRKRLMYLASFSPALQKQKEEMPLPRRTTFLPYKQGFLFSCLGFRSTCYGATTHRFAGTTTTISPPLT